MKSIGNIDVQGGGGGDLEDVKRTSQKGSGVDAVPDVIVTLRKDTEICKEKRGESLIRCLQWSQGRTSNVQRQRRYKCVAGIEVRRTG